MDVADDEAHVWAVPLVARRVDWGELWSMLAPDERDRADGFHFDRLKRRYVIARCALRRLLGGYLGVEPAAVRLTTDPNGKPRIGDVHSTSSLKFNVSHSGDLALIGFTTGCEVGVDVEQIREVGRLEQIARRFYHPSETEAILAAPAEERNKAFFRCWTGKEAVLKAVGSGVTGSLAAFQVPRSASGKGWIEWSANPFAGKRWRCWLQPLSPCDGYAAAIAFVDWQRRVRSFVLAM
ncbi:MAG TPA: 4'-phosphopantetheinyl transferase superfamily protein [Lacipirellulaceae bacterium]|nr:4'-phosphopantetheinyl transferase superfamily protein [Lacipirellulaceae bacterium]